MPRYYFDLSDGTREPDETGTELPDHLTAETEAIRFLGEVLKHEPRRLADGALRVNVRDEQRRHIRVIAITIEAGTTG